MPGYIAATSVPPVVQAVCPRCAAGRYFKALGTVGLYRCNGCEWEFTFAAGGSPVNTSASVSAGGLALTFASGGTVFVQGSALFISDTTLTEIVAVTGTPSATNVPVSALANAHGSGKAVSIATVTSSFNQ
jgi:rubredoxin